MDITEILKRGETFVDENSPTILTTVGVVGTVATAVLTGRATVKATRLVDGKQMHVGTEEQRELTKKEIVGLTWSLYIPPVGAGGVTIASIIMANRVSSKKTAAFAAAYGLSEGAFREYREKIVQKLGENKEQAARDEIAQERINANPMNTREVIIAGTGESLCFDMLSGRYFLSSVERIRKAENEVNGNIFNHMYASLSEFYDEIGLPPTMFSDNVGFNTDHMVNIQFSTVMSIDDRPCIAINFETGPVENYRQLYG